MSNKEGIIKQKKCRTITIVRHDYHTLFAGLHTSAHRKATKPAERTRRLFVRRSVASLANIFAMNKSVTSKLIQRYEGNERIVAFLCNIINLCDQCYAKDAAKELEVEDDEEDDGLKL